MIELNFPNPVSDERDFYNRREEREVIEGVLSKRSDRPVIILGERRIGKTSLQRVTAKRVAADSTGDLVPLFLPAATAIDSLEDFAKEILQELCSHIDGSPKETGLFNGRGEFRLASIGQFIDAVTELLTDIEDKRFLICMDEFDAVLKKSADTDKILALTEELIESDLPLGVFLTMTRPPESVVESDKSPLIASSEVVEAGPFSLQDATEMVHGLLGGRAHWSDEALDRLFVLSGGHPYFIKLFLDRLLARYLPVENSLSITPQMLNEVLPDATRDPRARYAVENIYNVHFDPKEQKALMLFLAGRERGVAEIELEVLGGAFVTAANELRRRGYLTKFDDGSYDFRIEYLRWWMRDWERFEEEWERFELEGAKRRLKRLEDPWENTQVTSVSERKLREYGLRP